MTNIVLSKNIPFGDNEVQHVMSYKYIGHEIRTGRDNQTCEIFRKMGLTWVSFGRLIFENPVSQNFLCVRKVSFLTTCPAFHGVWS